MLADSYIGITVLLVALVPSWLISEFLLKRFKRSTLQAMGVKKGTPAKILDPRSAPFNKEIQSELQIREIQISKTVVPPGLVGAIWSYVIAGLVFGGITLTFNFWGDGHTPSMLAVGVLLTWSLVPCLMAIILVASFSLKSTLYFIAAYLLLLFGLTAISTFHPESINSYGDELKGWTAYNIVPLLISVLLLNQRIRGVAPLILTIGYIFVLGINAWVDLTDFFGFASGLLFAVVTLTVALVVLGTAWKAVNLLANAYSRKAFSDQRLTINLVFLIFAASYIIPGDNQLFVWVLEVLAALLAYLFLSRFLLKIWAQPSSSPGNLLILRVFSLGKRSGALFRNLAKFWRRIGTTSLLSGPDLLESTVEPNEFLLFLSGRWKQILSQTRDRGFLALETSTAEPDPDGLYRVDEYFCRDDNWQETMIDLAKKSDVVLMDVRSLATTNLGSLYELQQLMNYVELDRIVLLVESSALDSFLHATLQQFWKRIAPDSVNRGLVHPEISVFRPLNGISHQVPELVSLLRERSLRMSPVRAG